MGKILPAAVFGFGLIALGWWGQADHAAEIEAHLTESASETLAGTTRHALQTTVSGRDITVSGFAHDEAERDQILATLDGLDGRRVVHSELQLLPTADVYFIEAEKTDSGLKLTGFAPDAVQLDAIKAAYPDANSDGLSLASGEPNADWARAATASIGALGELDTGTMRMEGTSVFISGAAAGATTRGEVETKLAALPAGYAQNSDIEVPESVELSLTLDAIDGAQLSGTAPDGFDTSDAARVLGLTEIKDDVALGAQGSAEAVMSKFEALAPWVSEFETLSFSITDSNTDLVGEAAAGVDTGTLMRSIKNTIGAGAVNVTNAAAAVDDGVMRTNALSGEQEQVSNGFWLPVDSFTVSAEACETRSNALLQQADISFIPNSAELDLGTRAAVNEIAGLLLTCVGDANLTAEVVGHTDNQGSDESNLKLSEARAQTVVAALVERGIPQDKLIALGLGATQPISDNSTAEGRAENRRTEIRWISN